MVKSEGEKLIQTQGNKLEKSGEYSMEKPSGLGRTYVISDVHGCYDQFIQLLEKIKFSDKDRLILLGDLVDRGPHSCKLLRFVMQSPNIYPILGNHDYFAYKNLRWLTSTFSADSTKKIDRDSVEIFFEWVKDGGESTVNEFRMLNGNQRQQIIEFLSEFYFYKELTVNERKFVLVHAGIENFQRNKPMIDYEFYDLIFEHPNYQVEYFPDRFLVTGHTPTRIIRKLVGQSNNDGNDDLIFRTHHHIAIDSGCVYGGRLAALCLDDLSEYYVDGPNVLGGDRI